MAAQTEFEDKKLRDEIDDVETELDVLLATDFSPIEEKDSPPQVTNRNTAAYKYFLKIQPLLPEWWNEFNTALDKGKQKYRSVLQFAIAKTKNKLERQLIVEMIGTGPVGKKVIRVPYLGDWKLRRSQNFVVPQLPYQLKTLARSIKDKLQNVEAVRSIAPYIVQKQMQFEKMDQELDEAFCGQTFDPEYPPTHYKNTARWEAYFKMKKAILTMHMKLWHEWMLVHGLHPDNPAQMVQWNQIVASVGTPAGALGPLGEVDYKEFEILKLARHLRSHAEMFNMPLPKTLAGEEVTPPPKATEAPRKTNGKGVQ